MAPLSRLRVLRGLDERARRLDARAADLDARAERLAAAEQRLQVAQPVNPAVHDVPAYPLELGPVASELLGRLEPADVAEVERRLEGDLAEHWEHLDPATRGYLTLHAGVHHRVPAVLEKTGLIPDEPPEGVHAMSRGMLAAGGDPALADLIVGTLAQAGRSVPSNGAALDFGCSTGRALRVLAAVRPDVRWQGCDPNDEAVAWAAQHLAPATFFRSPQRPPLDVSPGALDLIFAISIWSHFDERPALDWLREAQRVLRPGGQLLVTTHGPASVARQLTSGAMVPGDGVRCTEALNRRGFWFSPVFGEDGDHGVLDDGWGMAYMTAEWLVARMLPGWSLLVYEPGRLDANQDVYLFERR